MASLILAASLALPLVLPAHATDLQRRWTTTVTLDQSTTFQTVDGFGCSQAFQRAEDIFGKYGLSASNQQAVLDLLFDVDNGAGFSILRNGVGSSNSSASNFMNSIEPFPPSPPTPAGTPNYTWNGYDSAQLPLSQQAISRGVPYIYADAWSAPGYMKTNHDDANGGYLCGVGNRTCASGDWKQAYADYLVQYVQYYAQSGVNITHLGFLNEPSLKTTYASMLSNGTEAADFIRILGQTVQAAGLDIQLTCCDDYGWDYQANLLPGLQAVGPDGKSAQDYLSVVTGHGYESAPSYPLKTPLRTWLTEWADLSGDYHPYTFYNNSAPAEGMTWASNIQVAFAHANVSAFLYWIGAENSTSSSSLITFDAGNQIIPSKRFWAFASFSRFVRPGAVRIAADAGGASGVTVSAFKNTNGTVALQVLNNATDAYSLTLQWGAQGANTSVVPYITNNQYDLEAQTAVTLDSEGNGQATVPARSLVSFVQSA